MAGESRTPGIIQATEGVAYPLPWLAQTLNITHELLEQTLEKLKLTDRIKLNGDCIHIVNFDYYQAKRTEEDSAKEPDQYIKGQYGDLKRI
jgi:riboflavin synthase alpha subunit